MECYLITGKENQTELDEIYMQVLSDYLEYNTSSIFQYTNNKNIN